jgi:hypothetical protein
LQGPPKITQNWDFLVRKCAIWQPWSALEGVGWIVILETKGNGFFFFETDLGHLLPYP